MPILKKEKMPSNVMAIKITVTVIGRRILVELIDKEIAILYLREYFICNQIKNLRSENKLCYEVFVSQTVNHFY
ncbi:MAG: hypothetical protein COW71_09085 [Ignavibacteriales bacterium CG18_big_fil_WC_8_21_14_2_50_31_20]|nr:MAG: hypothetical protein COW71_09085 [Ignavibacteriales bacterium CG18_big_fil_WC_8_21_14_2_50_31_20]